MNIAAKLIAENVSVRIGAKTLIDDISLSFRPGQTVALVGPNGAGKSTLLRVLAGELHPQPGQVRLADRPLQAYRPQDLARHRAVLSQSISVAFPFTVAETVRMGAGDRSGKRIDALVDSALAEVGLDDFHDRVITTLSGGEQQRAHFARVLVQLAVGEEAHGPGVLLLDEPTASLDLRHQLDVLTAAQNCARRGVAVIAILHDLNLAAHTADRVVVLHGGRVTADGTPAETITAQMVETVFGVAAPICAVPAQGVPFVLPQTMSVVR